jgi:hypothetical protein
MGSKAAPVSLLLRLVNADGRDENRAANDGATVVITGLAIRFS